MAKHPPYGFGTGAPAAANDNRRTIVAANDNDLRDPDSVRRLAEATVTLGLSRRAFLNFLAETIYWFDGCITWSDGTPFAISDTLIDDHFPDGSARWVSAFWRFAETPPRQPGQARVCPRLRIIRLALEIADPDFRQRVNHRPEDHPEPD